MSRSRPPQRAQHNTSTSKALAISWAHVQFRRGERVVGKATGHPRRQGRVNQLVWDLLGLYFCCQEPYDDYIEPVPTSYAGSDEDGVRLTLTPAGPCRAQLAFRTLPRSSYENVESFRRVWFQADVGLMDFLLV